jgi:hypothetical protein
VPKGRDLNVPTLAMLDAGSESDVLREADKPIKIFEQRSAALRRAAAFLSRTS